MPKTKTKKAKRKPAGKKNRVPLISNPNIVADMRCLSGWDAFQAFADKVIQFWVDRSEWQDSCRKAFKEGKTVEQLPTLAASKIPNPNAGRMSWPANVKLIDEYNDAVDAGGTLPAHPPRYCPVERELIVAIGCTVIRRGKVEKQPKDWNEKKWGSWFHKDENGERTIPSGWVLDSEPQRSFHKAVDKMVNLPADNIVTVGGVRYVVGAGPKSSEAALYQMDCFTIGNGGAIWDVRRRLGMAKTKGITNLVFRIEDKPNAGSCVKIDMVGNGSFNFFLPGQAATPGYLTNDNGKEMNAAQVRKAAADDVKGIKFSPILREDAIVGEIVWMDDAWPEIKRAFKASKRDTTETNAVTQSRVSHDEGYPYGFRGASIGVVPSVCWGFDGSKYHFGMGLTIGSRINAEYHVTKKEALTAWKEENPEAEVSLEAEAEAEAAEPKKARKKAAKKTKTPDLKIVVEEEPAAPIDADTADEDAVDQDQREAAEADIAAVGDEE